jgi:putative aldouronate transport system permease protein
MSKTIIKNEPFAKKVKRFSTYLPLLIMTLPGFIYLIINNYIPMFGISIAFRNIDFSKGIFNSPFIGFDNFKYLFSTQDAFVITRNTLLYNVMFIIINTTVAVFVSIFLSEIKNKKLLKVNQTVMLLPHLISMVIVAYLVNAFLSADNGFINKTILPSLGMDSISWYNEPKYWPFLLPIVSAWKGFGYLSVIYLATIVGIDTSFYEAADIDGATRWQQIKTITLPLLTPTIIMMTLLSIGRIFYSDFGLFYQVPMNSGTLYNTTNTIDTYVYRGLMQLGDIGMSSAAGVYQSIVGFTLVVLSNMFVKKMNPESALF